jgi:hypothetical protein
MTVAFFIIVIGIWVLYSGWRFYKEVDWSKSPSVATPDIGAMRKREKELLHIQELLEEARAEGKISRALLDEYNRFCDEEIAGMHKLTSPSKS